MKILILSFYYSPDLCPGSFRCTSFVEQLRKLVGTDCQIDVITTIPNRYASFQVHAENTEESYGLTIHRIDLPSHKSGMLDQAKAFLYFAKKARKLVKAKNYDLVFATSSRLMTAVLGAYLARQKNAKLYLDVRDIFTDTLPNILPGYMSIGISPMFLMLEKWAFKRAQHINIISGGFSEYFQAVYPHIPLSHFSNGVDPEFENFNEDFKKQVATPYQVLYAGNIGEGQGLHLILPKLAKQMEGMLNFRVIGDGGRRSQLAAEILAQGCSNIELLPPVGRDNLMMEYQNADILFLHLNDYPAFKKVLPSKIFEYAASGKPIWAGVAGHAAEFIRNEVDNTSVFQPCDVENAKQAFYQLPIQFKPRTSFIEKYRRQTIMKSLALDVLALLE